MVRDIYLGDLAYALGDVCETLEEASAKGRLLSSVSALREAGFELHHLCRTGGSAYELVSRMLKPMQERLRGTDVLVYTTSLPGNGNIGSEDKYRETRDVKYVMDFPASHLQADFHLDGVMVVGVNQLACVSLLAGIRLAAMILRAEPLLSKALCVTGDRFPEGALYEQAYNVISDGAAGCLVTTEPSDFRFIGGHGITNGAMTVASDDQTIGSYFTYTHRLLTELLVRHQLTMNDVRWIVPQNINVVTWQVLSSLLKIDRERVLFPTMPKVGHMISGDNIVNLKVLLDDGRFKPGDRILLPMAGYGLNWQCILIEKV